MALSPTTSRGSSSPLTTKGDLFTYDTANARLAVGANTFLLTADSAQTAGIKWAAAPSTGAVTLLSTTTLGADGTFDVSAISGSYNDLLLVLIARATRAAAPGDSAMIRFNNDSGANYDSEVSYATGTTPAAFGNNGGTFGYLDVLPAATGTANRFGVTTIMVYGYASTGWQKSYTTGWHSDQDSTQRHAGVAAGTWRSTAAITRVQILGEVTANLLSGSQLRIYGVL